MRREEKKGKGFNRRELRKRETVRRKRASFFKKALVVMVTVFAVVLVLQSPIFTLSTVELIGNERTSLQELANAGIVEGVNIFSVSSSRSKDYLLQNPYIRSVDIVKVFPDKIVVTVRERKARAYIEYENMNTYVAVDETGMVLATTPRIVDTDLPVVVGISFTSMVIGHELEVDDPDAFDVVVTLSKVFESNKLSSVDKINVSDLQDIHVYVGKYDVLIGGIDRVEEKIAYFKEALDSGRLPDVRGTFNVKNPDKDGWFSISF